MLGDARANKPFQKHSSHSEHSSSFRQTSSFQHLEGLQEEGSRDTGNSESGWRPQEVPASPFNGYGKQLPEHTHDSVRFTNTLPDTSSEDNCRIVRQKPAPDPASGPERTKSKLLADIADQMSRNQHLRPGHSRQSSGDSQESCRDPLRKARKRRWQLAKAYSAPNEDAYIAAATPAWQTNSPSESRNWATEIYHQQQPHAQSQAANAYPDFDAMRSRPQGRKRYSGRFRTSRFIGVGSSNRKTQWQARILVQGKVTHLGYYGTEEEAARVYDRVALSLNPSAQTNFPACHYPKGSSAQFSGLGREDLQRALGVKPMDKSSRFRGVSRKKGKWEAKVMVNRKWAYRALFDSEDEAAHAYDAAVWRLKPKEATSFVNFKDGKSVRDTPKQSPKASPTIAGSPGQPEANPVKMEISDQAPDVNAVTLTEMHIPEGPDTHQDLSMHGSTPLLVSEPMRTQSVPIPLHGSDLRTQSVPLPLNGSDLGIDSSALPPMPTLDDEPSLPSDLGLTGSEAGMETAVPPALSRQQSMCDAPCLPAFPPLPPLAVSVVPRMDLPDPNSIGVPPPANLPFPELVAGGSSSLGAGANNTVPSRASTPTQAGSSSFFSSQLSPTRAYSGGLPPLGGRSSASTMEGNKRFMAGLPSFNPATPMSPGDLRTDPHLQATSFYDTASGPHSNGLAQTCGVSSLSTYDSQPHSYPALDRAAHLQATHTEGFLDNTAIPADLPFTASVETSPPVRYMPRLPQTASLVSISSSQYAPPTHQETLGDLYASGRLNPVDSSLHYDRACSLANSRSASSNFLHAMQATNSPLLCPGSSASGLPLYHDLRVMGHDIVPPPPLAHTTSMDSTFLARQDMMKEQLLASRLPNMNSSLPDARSLNAEQAVLLANLDIDVASNDPLPINPVQIGGENMNVYSADIMGDILR